MRECDRERGDIERRGEREREGDRDLDLAVLGVWDRVRERPRDGDLEGIVGFSDDNDRGRTETMDVFDIRDAFGQVENLEQAQALPSMVDPCYGKETRF